MPSAEKYTTEQEHVVELPVDARALVDAPAGTGKTHVLAARLTHLIDRDGLSAGDEVIVLSFSRAAVAELRRRVGGLGGDARYVGATTFDSFATRLLAAEDAGGDWSKLDYEGRIAAATELLRAEQLPAPIALARHVLVDELQDVVGSRAALVLALLQRLDAGFTLFGDPAQAIYGHQVRAKPDELTTDQFYKSLLKLFDPVSRWTLTHDFRSTVAERSAIAEVGSQLRSGDPAHNEIDAMLRTILLRLTTLTLGAARRLMLRPDAGVSAILCRTNAEALRLSQLLFEHAIPHRYQRRGEEKAAMAWLSRVLQDVPEARTMRSVLLPRLEQVASSGSLSADDMFALLRKLDPARGDAVDLRRIGDRLRIGDIPEEANEVVSAPVVVSTIHRAKGLEFDRVLLCYGGDRDEDDLGEENRLRYVALSRARKEVFHLDRPNTTGLAIDRATGRWVRRGFGKSRSRVFEVEVIGSDTESVYPAGTSVFEADAQAVQRYLAEKVGPGDPVVLVLASSNEVENQRARYVVEHNGRPVAVTSEEFGTTLARILGSTSRAPSSISGLHVEMLDSVAGNPDVAGRNGLGAHGIWGRVRVFGLGSLELGNGNKGE